MNDVASSGDPPPSPVRVRRTEEEDIPALVRLSALSYSPLLGWWEEEFRSHLRVFPEGQLVAEVEDGEGDGEIVGLAASLILRREAFEPAVDWYEITGDGLFTTHDPRGETLYGAGVLVAEGARGQGVGSALYDAREALLRKLGLQRILAGARISGYHEVSDRLTAWEYVHEVVEGRRTDPTLSFQLARGFRVLQVVPGYLPEDRESVGYAAEVEWRPAGARDP